MSSKKKYFWFAASGLVIGGALTITANHFYEKSSENESCMSCHIHPQSDNSWKQSVHYNNESEIGRAHV